jgi:Glycosyl hydrolase family 63 C-terminal domain
MYTELRLNLVDTVFKSWKETGFAWEQYNPDTGKGQRTQHFTGWTSLIVRVLAMPDLQLASKPQMPGYVDQPTETDGRGIRLTLTVMGMLVICFGFRRRLMRVWKALMGK